MSKVNKNTTEYFCPVCGTALMLQYSDKIGRFEHHTMSCQNDKCTLD